METPETTQPTDFIREAIRQDLADGRFDRVHTRFPPEPNAYLHIGHAKALWINYGIAQEFGGKFNLRFDDTNPLKEEQEFVDGIVEDVAWILSAVTPPPGPLPTTQSIRGEGELPLTPLPPLPAIHRGEGEFSTPPPSPLPTTQSIRGEGESEGFIPLFGSDYFEQMYAWAVDLIKKGKAFVCDLSAEQMRETRGTLTEPGQNSPFRERSVEENLDLFSRMRGGEFPDGAKTLRAKIDMGSPNINLRDPVMYRIRHAHHHRQGDAWCIYPSYDWAHGLEDSIEGITHSLCSLEYEIHRPLYDWFLDELGIYHPRQIEFGRLGLSYTVMSKRRFIDLVEGGHVKGYDDPRMPTLAGMRRRGYRPEAIWEFCRRAGVGGKSNVTVDAHMLEDCVREDLNKTALRVMGVLDPIKVVLTNYPAGQVEELEAINNPEDPSAGTRRVPFSRELYIERDDFREDPPPKFFRLSPGREVRLRYAYFITCQEVVKDADGEIIELRCTYDPATRGGDAPDGRKVKATMHWVSAAHALPCEVRLYDHLFRVPDPDEGGDWLANLNPDSMKVVTGQIEPSVAGAEPGTRYQFERLGYFAVDSDTSSPPPQPLPHQARAILTGEGLDFSASSPTPSPTPPPSGTNILTGEGLVFNRTATLRDAWANIQRGGG